MDFQTTPQPQDLYGRYQVQAFDESELIGVPTGFQSLFGVPATGARTVYALDSEDVDIDIKRGREDLAALVPRGMNGRSLGPTQKNIDIGKFTNFNRVFPLIEEEGDLGAAKILKRVAGENPYGGMTKLDRLRQGARRIHAEQVRRMLRLHEYLAATSVVTGKMPAIMGTVDPDLIYDFRRKATHTKTLAKAWTDTTALALDDLGVGAKLVRTDGHLTADYAVMGEDALKAFLNTTQIKDTANSRRIELIRVSTTTPVPAKLQHLVDGGFVPYGLVQTLNGFSLWLFTYTDVYTDNAGNATEYLEKGTVVIGSSVARFDRYFGPSEVLPEIPQRQEWYRQLFGFDMSVPPMPPKIKNLNAVVNPGMFFFDAYPSEDWKRVTVRAQSGPIFATTHTDSLYVITNAA